MLKLVIVLAVVFTVGPTALAQSQDTQSVATRFGVLSVNEVPKDMTNGEEDQRIINDNSIVISIPEDGHYYLGKDEVRKEQIKDKVEKALALIKKEEDKIVYIKSGVGVSYGEVVNIIKEVRALGVDKIGLVADKKKGEDKILLFKGQPLVPTIEGNNSLDLGTVMSIGATDVVLVTNNGGSGCPAVFYFVSVTRSGAKATPEFGTCSDLATVKRKGNSISVTMPGFLGPFEPKSAQRRVAKERHVFIYRAGVVTENGKPVK